MYVKSPVVLIYHTAQEQMQRLNRVCALCRLELKALPDEDANLPLGAAADAKGWLNPLLAQTHNTEDPGPLTEPLLVMAGFDDRMIDRFLAAMRAENLSISMKAVLTDNNANWNALQLAGHIAQERQMIINRNKMK